MHAQNSAMQFFFALDDSRSHVIFHLCLRSPHKVYPGIFQRSINLYTFFSILGKFYGQIRKNLPDYYKPRVKVDSFFASFEVGQLTSGAAFNSKRSSNSGLISSDLPPPYPSHSPRPGSVHHPGTRRTSSTAQNSVPGSPILGARNNPRGFSPVRDQRMFIASFCRLEKLP